MLVKESPEVESPKVESPKVASHQLRERCQICGAEEEVHACLQAIPSSLLTLQDPRIGSVVADYYILEEFVCANSTNMVYKARHQLLHTHVAVKISNDGNITDPFSSLRTSRAALIALQLDHPSIVRCINFTHETDGNAVLVMEWARGTALSQVIAQEVALPPIRALNLIEGLCEALRYAQANGVNHINLKPSGVIVSHANGYEQPRLLDFGLMKMLGPHTLEATLNSEHFKYASPEERLGQPPDQRSMNYSLGMILFEMLTGLVDSLDSGIGSNAKINIPSLAKIYPEMQEASLLDKILSKCLAAKPSQRFQNVDELSLAVNQTRAELERIERVNQTVERINQKEETGQSVAIVILLLMALATCVLFAFQNSIALR